MKPELRVWLLVGLSFVVIIAGVYFSMLRRSMRQSAKTQEQTEGQARRELTQPTVTSPSDPRVKAQFFWSSGNNDGSLTPVSVELTLSGDPVVRSKQLLNTLLAGPVDVELRTLPTDAALLAFYLLPNGTAIADFSDALATSTPSGIESEQMAVDSITKTLQANVPQIRRLKILIHGQEVETLAGHLDLSGTFIVNENPVPAAAPSGSLGSAASPSASLTPPVAPGKLAQLARKP
jgi:sporulation and spore germination protein